MKPIVKWQGGKRKELPHIRPFIPDNISNIAEPFCGGAAVAFDHEGIAYLNDNNPHVINLYRVLQSVAHFERMMMYIDVAKSNPAGLESLYYKSREIVNTYDFSDPFEASHCSSFQASASAVDFTLGSIFWFFEFGWPN